MSEKSLADVLQSIKRLEDMGTISHDEKDDLWRRALKEGPTDDLIDEIEVYRSRIVRIPGAPKEKPQKQEEPPQLKQEHPQSSSVPVIGIVAVALGAVSLFMPYIVNLAVVPVAIVCGVVAYNNPLSKKFGRIALILSIISLAYVLYTSNKISNIFSPSDSIFATNEARPTVTASEYGALYEGMSYRDVVRIIGTEGTETSSSRIGEYRTASYQWINHDGSNVIAIFVDDQLTTKSQFGLR